MPQNLSLEKLSKLVVKNAGMLSIIRNRREIPFGDLLTIYEETLTKNGREYYPDQPPYKQRFLAEHDFYTYLTDCFFRTPGAYYALWYAEGRTTAALRMEPYLDGFLLEGLETAPDCRRRGYAVLLVQSVLDGLPENGQKIYSHVARDNAASLAVHRKCGFRKILAYARCIDGSILPEMITMLFER